MTKVGVIFDRELLKPMDQRVLKEAISLKNIGYEVEIITPHVETLTKEMEDIKIHCIKLLKILRIRAQIFQRGGSGISLNSLNS